MVDKKEKTKKRRRRGRPLKEESNAIQLEKNVIEMKEAFIAMVPEAHKVLRDLMNNPKTKENIRQSIATYVLEKADAMQAEYDEMFDDNEFLKKMLVVKGDDNINDIASKIDAVRKNKKLIIEEYLKFRKKYSKKAETQFKKFMK